MTEPDTSNDEVRIDRRTVLKGLGGVGLVASTSLAGCSSEPAPSEKRRIILVESGLYANADVETEIDRLVDRWVTDGQPRDTIEIRTVEHDDDPATIREDLKLEGVEATETTTDEGIPPVDGIFILGNVPSWHVDGSKRYYTDLPYAVPSVELVKNGDYFQEQIEPGATGTDPVAVGRYTPKRIDGDTEAERTVAYLEKLNQYWDYVDRGHDEDVPFERALVFMDQGLQVTDNKPMMSQVGQSYTPPNELTFADGPDAGESGTSAEAYRSALDTGWEWVTLGVHGNAQFQSFRNGQMSADDYVDLDPPVRFYHLQSCQNGTYRVYGRLQYNLAENVLRSTSDAVGVLANSTSIWMEETRWFYEDINRGLPLGKAIARFYYDRVRRADENTPDGDPIPIDTDALAPHVFGDPFMRISWRPEIEKIYAYEPGSGSDVENEAKIEAAALGVPVDDEGGSYSRVATFKVSPYDPREVERVFLEARKSGTRDRYSIDDTLASVDGKRGAVMFDPPSEIDGWPRYEIKLRFREAKTRTRFSDSCQGRSATGIRECNAGLDR